jgi:hypothetical protein
MAIKGAQLYRDEGAKAGGALGLGQSIGLARLLDIGNSYAEAMEGARNDRPSHFATLLEILSSDSGNRSFWHQKVMPEFMG